MFIAFVRGFGTAIEHEVHAEQDSGMSRMEWMNDQYLVFEPLIAQLPTLSRLAGSPDLDMSLDALFDQGLKTMLDGFAVRLSRKDRAPA
jgi:hypothetical protein